MAQRVKNPTSIHKDEGSIPGLFSGLKDLVLLQAAVQVTHMAWIWHCCGVGQQLQLPFDPQPGNFHMLQVCAPPPIKIFWVMFNFLRSCQTVSKSGCTILFFYQHALRVSFSLRVSRHLLLFVSLIISVLVGVKCYLSVGFFLFFCFFCFLWPPLRHMEVPM